MHRCALVSKQESRTQVVGKCEIYKEERDVLEEEMMKIDGCGMEKFDTPDNIEKTIAILGDRWGPQTAKQQGDKINKKFPCDIRKKRDGRPNVGDVTIRSRNGAPCRKRCVVNSLSLIHI